MGVYFEFHFSRKILLEPLFMLLENLFNMKPIIGNPISVLSYSWRRTRVRVVVKACDHGVGVLVYSTNYDLEGRIAGFIEEFLGPPTVKLNFCPNIAAPIVEKLMEVGEQCP